MLFGSYFQKGEGEFFDSLACGVVATDSQGCIRLINTQAAAMAGVQRNRMLGRQLNRFMPGVAPHFEKCLQSTRGNSYGRIRINGRLLKITVDCLPRRGGESGVVGLIDYPSARTPEAVRQFFVRQELFEQLQTIFMHSSDGLWLCDSNGKILHINAAAEALNGIQAEEVMGKSLDMLLQAREAVPEHSITKVALETRRPVSMVQYLSKTGKHVLVTATPTFQSNGELAFVVINMRDLTYLNDLNEQLRHTLRINNQIQAKLDTMMRGQCTDETFIASSPAMEKVLTMALKVARLQRFNALLLGESGVGKGWLAKLIHRHGKTEEKPFVSVNCAALPENLLEAELFGYEKGAFTGAAQQGKAGLFELAHGGTLFLDEIGDTPLSIQAKLLKCLDDRKVMRLGGLRSKKINCAIIAATNQDLPALVKRGRFRHDLYYRLNAFTIKIPPLRERAMDILDLAEHFLTRYNTQFKLRRTLSPAAMDLLRKYTYPGNIRELKNILKHAMVMSEDMDLRAYLAAAMESESRLATGEAVPGGATLADRLATFEKQVVAEALASYRTTRGVASHLGISQSTAARKIRGFGLRP